MKWPKKINVKDRKAYEKDEWFGCAVNDTIDQARQAVEEAVSVEIDEIINELYGYAEHSSKCLCSQSRAGEPTEDGGYRTLYGYDNQAKWYQRGEYPECSCGLEKVYQKAKNIRKQILTELWGGER